MAVQHLGFALALAHALAAQGVIYFDELASGDLSNNPGSPTLLVVGLGSNFVSASVSSRDRDYFTLQLPPGLGLAAVMLRRSDGVEATFLGLQAGEVFTEPPDFANLSRTLGYTEFFAPDVNTDLMPRLAAAPEAIGFSGPLAGFALTFWVEQRNTSPAIYELEFVTVQIPSPGPVALAITGLAASLWTGRRTRAKSGRTH